jgi:uncharacterized protein (TIGR03085 family)
MPSHSNVERHALANALTEAGPGAPTLCDGWTTNDLAAHLVVREGRPDALPGLILSSVPPFGRWTARVEDTYAKGDFAELVNTFRTGPHQLSWARLPGADRRLNLLEHFIHCEDVRRAQPGWKARTLSAGLQQAIWTAIGSTGRILLRRSPVPVTFSTVDGLTRHVVAGTGGSSNSRGSLPGVVITGDPGEIALYTYGRTGHADVQLDGPPESISLFQQVPLKF